MARGKKNEAKVEEPKQDTKVKANFVGLNKQRLKDTRMRIRDQLAETNKTINAEIDAQEAAMEADMVVDAPLTMTPQDIDNFSDTLKVMKKLWSGVSSMTAATDTKVISDLDTCITKLAGIKNMTLKAFTPEEKLEAAETLKENEAQLAELLAKVNAAKSVLS